jgi:hypothetical protein
MARLLRGAIRERLVMPMAMDQTLVRSQMTAVLT